MKEDSEIDNIFNKKLGHVSKTNVPQDYLDDINNALDNLPKNDDNIIDDVFKNTLGPVNAAAIPLNYLSNLNSKLDDLATTISTEIDDLFKEKLQPVKPQIVPGAYVDDINSRLDELPTEENKRKIRPVYWVLPVLGVLAFSVFYFMADKQNNIPVEEDSVTTSLNTTSSNTNLTSSIGSNNVKLANNIESENNNPVMGGAGNSFDENLTPTTNNSSGGLNTIKSPISTIVVADSLMSNNEKNTGTIIEKTIVITDSTKAKNTDSLSTLSKTEIKINDSLALVKLEDSICVVAHIKKDSIKKDSVARSMVNKKLPKIKHETFKSLQITAGAFYVNSLLNYTSPTIINQQNKSVKPVIGYDASAYFILNKNNFILSSGINYQQWKEQFNYELPVKTYDSIPYVSAYVISSTLIPNDDTITHVDAYGNTIIDEITIGFDTINSPTDTIYKKRVVENNDTLAKVVAYKYSYLSIPVVLGYQIGGETFSVTPKAGAALAVPIKSNSYYLNTKEEDVIENIKAPWFLNLQISIDFSKRYGSFSYSVIPIYRRTVYVIKEEKLSSNKYESMGINFGVTYHFE